MNPLHSWKLKPCAKQCALTGRAFEDGETIHTVIYANPDPSPNAPAYLRKDFSDEGWPQRTEEDRQAFSSWQSTYEAPAQQEEPALQLAQNSGQGPEVLLRQLIDQDESHTEKARYLLALMLERQKLLREIDTNTTPTGTLIRIYQHRKTDELFLIPDPQISLHELEPLQQEVHELLIPNPKSDATIG